MDLSPSESFNALYYALSHEEGAGHDSERCTANMVDTLLFHNGQPYRWLFTSEKTGMIMKRNGNQWNIDDIKHVFKRRFTTLRGKRTGEYRSKFAVIWYVDAPQKMTYRVVDEDELDYLLQNRFFTQYIAAVQLYFGGYPLKGSGWFEHRVWTDDRDKEFHQTSELILPPPQPDFLDLNKFISGINSVIESGADLSAPSASADTSRRLYITESQHEYLKPVASKLLRYLRAYTHCKVVDATFMFGFNSTWAPFVMGVRNVQLREVPQSVQLMRAKMFSSFDSMFTRDMQIQTGAIKRQASSVPSAPAAAVPEPHAHKAPHLKSVSRLDSMDVIPSFNFGQEQEREAPPEELSGDPTDPENVPKPNFAALRAGGAGQGANIDYSKREEVPASVSGARLASSLPSGAAPPAAPSAAPIALTASPPSPSAKKMDPRAVGAGGNPILNQKVSGDASDSILNDYALAYGIGFRTDQTALEEQRGERQRGARSNIMRDFQSEKSRRTLSSAAVASKTQAKFGSEGKAAAQRYAQITDTWSRRVKAYPSQVRGSQDETWEEFRRTLRPLSAPLSPGQTMLSRSMSGPIPTGFHGKLKNTRKATGIEKRSTTTRGAHCHGDFCALAPQLVKATQDRQRQQEREEEERRDRERRRAEEDRRRAEEAAAASKGAKGYINFSMLAAVAMKEREREVAAASSAGDHDVHFATPARASMGATSAAPFSRGDRIKQAHKTPATHDIPCKSIMMARVEERFTGFNYLDLVHQYTQMGFALEDILSECARMSLTAVADKCRAEAFRSACTQRSTPDMNSLNAMEAAHRKLVYSDALSTVHPSKFYQTVPVCETCFQLYSCLDALREVIVFLRQDTNTNGGVQTVLPAGVTEAASHSKSVFSNGNSSGENDYYKNLQKSLSKYSREGSDGANSAEQQMLNTRLATPKVKTEKFSRPQSAMGSRDRSAERSPGSPSQLDESSFPRSRQPFAGSSRRPQTAGARRKDYLIEGQISDRRTSKLPYDSRRKQHNTQSKFVSQKRAVPSSLQLGTVEDTSEQESSVVQNNSSYFAGETEDDELEKSSYLLLAKAVPRVHSQSGPTLGGYPVTFAGAVPSRSPQNLADPDKKEQQKNLQNIKVAENVQRTRNSVVVTDQHGAQHSYNNLQFVHSI